MADPIHPRSTRPPLCTALALILVAMAMMAGCMTRYAPKADPQLLAFLTDGRTSKSEVLLHLGFPSRQMENNRIVMFRIGHVENRGYYVREAIATGWEDTKYSLVLVFDDKDVLQRHSLVEVR